MVVEELPMLRTLQIMYDKDRIWRRARMLMLLPRMKREREKKSKSKYPHAKERRFFYALVQEKRRLI